MTNNKDVYIKCDGYTDHGHDHLGGATVEQIFILLLVTILELVNCMLQLVLHKLRKLDTFLAIQKKNHAHLKRNYFSKFRKLPFEPFPIQQVIAALF